MRKLCRKLYKEFFYVPKYGKVREKVMMTRVTTMLTVIIVCLAAMSSTAYAFFSYNVTSSANTIKTANFATDVSIKIESSGGEDVEVRTSDHISHTAALVGGKTYYIMLQQTNKSTAKTGYMVVTATNCNSKYYTRQIGRNDDGTSEKVAFELKPTADTVITFCSRWGTSSVYPDFKDIRDDKDLYIQDEETIALRINAAINSVTNNTTRPIVNATRPTENTMLPTTKNTTPPSESTVPSQTAETGEPTAITEPSSATEPLASTNATEPVETEPMEVTVSTETQPATETTETTEGTETTEATEITQATEATEEYTQPVSQNGE